MSIDILQGRVDKIDIRVNTNCIGHGRPRCVLPRQVSFRLHEKTKTLPHSADTYNLLSPGSKACTSGSTPTGCVAKTCNGFQVYDGQHVIPLAHQEREPCRLYHRWFRKTLRRLPRLR